MNGYTRIRTPYLYPDGDVIDLFLRQEEGEATLTDLGETLRWLRMQSIAQRRSPRQNKLIRDACLNHGVELFRGMLMARVKPSDDLSSAVTRLAQAALRVSDVWFTMRTRVFESITDEVEGFLDERHMRFDRGETLPGRSGRTWTVDFHIRHPRRSALMCVLSTASRAAARGIAEHVTSEWHDLSHLKLGPEALAFISLFDDSLDVWNPEDFRLVGELSEVAFWSKPDELVERLVA
ncbi:MAG TPA: DUF1828 domain-containing protein [Terriglobia bacterium]|nr:DUF1828 domain-containing protein [Terriglobia bacterium]